MNELKAGVIAFVLGLPMVVGLVALINGDLRGLIGVAISFILCFVCWRMTE